MLEDGSNEDFAEGLGFDPICAAAAVAVVMMVILVAWLVSQWRRRAKQITEDGIRTPAGFTSSKFSAARSPPRPDLPAFMTETVGVDLPR
jgi:hypothetical protein